LGEVLVVAGHSLGEYSALVAAGALSFSDAVALVRERGRLMQEAARQRPGGMAAILGLSTEVVTEACREAQEETGTIVQVANHNSPGQTVISGELTGLETAAQLLKQGGARRVVPLAVSTAAHCPLMDSAARGLREALDRIEFREAGIPIIANVTGRPLVRAEEIREELVKQMVSPVQWVESVRCMIEQGARTFVEIGPKDTLTNLIKRISDRVDRTSVGDAAGVEAWSEGAVGAHSSVAE